MQNLSQNYSSYPNANTNRATFNPRLRTYILYFNITLLLPACSQAILQTTVAFNFAVMPTSKLDHHTMLLDVELKY